MPRVHFTAPIHAFSASSDGRSTPLFGSGAWSSINALLTLSDFFAGGAVERSAQRLVIPAAARTVPVDRFRGPFRARLLLGHTFWRRLNVRPYERKCDH